MRFIESQCKICGGRVVLRFEDRGLTEPEMESVGQAVDKFAPMVCCDPCYDAHDQRQRAGEAIFDTCCSLSRVPAARRTGPIIAQARAALECALPLYSKAIARQMKAAVVIYHGSGVDLLIEKPEKCSEILRALREEYRKQGREAVAA